MSWAATVIRGSLRVLANLGAAWRAPDVIKPIHPKGETAFLGGYQGMLGVQCRSTFLEALSCPHYHCSFQGRIFEETLPLLILAADRTDGRSEPPQTHYQAQSA